MLRKDPNERICMFELRQHPWIAKYRRKKLNFDWQDSDDSSEDAKTSKQKEN